MANKTFELIDFPLDLTVEIEHTRGRKSRDWDSPDDSDEYEVTDILFNGISIMNDELANVVEQHLLDSGKLD